MAARSTPPKKGDQASYLPTSAKRGVQGPAVASTASSGGAGQISKQQSQYNPGSPIRFYDEEVERMKRAVDKQAPKDRQIARQELRARPRRHRSRITLTGFFLRVAALYVLIAYFFVCPNEPDSDRAVCRALNGTSDRLRQFEPHVRPYVHHARQRLHPYWVETRKHVEPYLGGLDATYQRAQSTYAQVDRVARPHLVHLQRLYAQRVVPLTSALVQRLRVLLQPVTAKLSKQYEKTLAPSVEWYGEEVRRQTAPYVRQADELQKHVRKEYVQPALRDGSRLVQEAAARGQHHWSRHVVPFSRTAYARSRRTYKLQIRPRVVTVSRSTARLFRTRVQPTLLRFWSRFIAPQLDKIRERIFEYKTQKASMEAAERVEKATAQLTEKQDEEEVEDFIKDLREEKLAEAAGGKEASLAEEAPPAYSATHAPPPPSPEEAAKLRAEKRAALETLHATYEREIAKLGQSEYGLLVDRLAELRGSAQEDVKARFEAALVGLDDEGDLMVGRLGKYFARVGADLREEEIEQKAREADVLAVKATARVQKAADAIKAEVAEYRSNLVKKELEAVGKAKAAVSDLVEQAQRELGQGWTWLDGVTAKDWQRFHGLRAAENNLHSRFVDAQSGAIEEARLAALEVDTLLDHYEQQPDKLVGVFQEILQKIKVKGQKEMKGEWLSVVPEAQKVYDAASDKLGSLAGGIKASASSAAGYEAAPTNAAESVSSAVKVAQVSASSLAKEALKALPTVEAHQEYLAAAKSAYGEVSQEVLRAGGIEPSPTHLRQTAMSLANIAASSASHAYGEASQSALKAAGREPSPTDLAQAAISARHAASASAASAFSHVVSDYPSSVSSALEAATQAVDQAAADALETASACASSAASVAASLAAPAATMLNAAPVRDTLGGAAERVDEFLGDVTEEVRSAVGAAPSPDELKQTAEGVAQQASSSLASVSGQRRTSSVTSRASQSASSAASTASSIASSLAQPHSSYSKSRVAASAASQTAAVKSAASGAASEANVHAEKASRKSASTAAATIPTREAIQHVEL